jgi:hypothetical protein
VDLDSAAEELYGVPADDFTEHRKRLAAQARAAGDKALAAEIGKLRKPVQAAALINELVRAEPAELTELTELGAQMRDAHRQLRGPELRALSEQRGQLLQRLADLVRGTAGQDERTVTDAVAEQVRGTFEAAIADEGAETAVLSGRLTTVLSYTGFGEVDVTDAVAAPVRRRHLKSVPTGADAAKPATGDKRSTATKSKPAEKSEPASEPARTKQPAPSAKLSSSSEEAHERRQQRHTEQLRRAEAEHAEAVRALDWAQEEAATAEQAHQEATARVEQLRAGLEQAQEQAWRAGQATRAAERTRQAAQQEADRTAGALQAARDQLDG